MQTVSERNTRARSAAAVVSWGCQQREATLRPSARRNHEYTVGGVLAISLGAVSRYGPLPPQIVKVERQNGQTLVKIRPNA